MEMVKTCPFQVRVNDHGYEPLSVRAMLVYTSPHYIQFAVSRCPHHAEASHDSNKGERWPASTTTTTRFLRGRWFHTFDACSCFAGVCAQNEEFLQHIIRADHQNAKYERSPSGRYSVIIPLDRPPPGTEFTTLLLQFACLGSCPGGINRRPTKLLLTIETRRWGEGFCLRVAVLCLFILHCLLERVSRIRNCGCLVFFKWIVGMPYTLFNLPSGKYFLMLPIY